MRVSSSPKTNCPLGFAIFLQLSCKLVHFTYRLLLCSKITIMLWHTSTDWAYNIPVIILALLHRYACSTPTRTQQTSTGGQQSYNHNQERQPTFVSTQYNHTIMYKSSPLNVHYRSLPHLPHGPTSLATLANAVLPNPRAHPTPNPS